MSKQDEILNITFHDLRGEPQALSQFKGNVLMVVNTASL